MDYLLSILIFLLLVVIIIIESLIMYRDMYRFHFSSCSIYTSTESRSSINTELVDKIRLTLTRSIKRDGNIIKEHRRHCVMVFHPPNFVACK